MARESRTTPVDLDRAHNITTNLIDRLACPEGKSQAFLRDALTPGLKVRVTPSGVKAFVVERKVGQTTVRRTLGSVLAMPIADARDAARDAYLALDRGVDLVAKANVERTKGFAVVTLSRTPVEVVWRTYIEENKPRWSERHLRSHLMASQFERPSLKCATKTVRIGPLRPLLDLRVSELTEDAIVEWLVSEIALHPTQTRQYFRVLSSFLNWCKHESRFKGGFVCTGEQLNNHRVKRILGKANVRNDCLLREQLPSWFQVVRSCGSATASHYLMILLLIGARPNELRMLKWEDIDFRWKTIEIRDKVEGVRKIPLTPYVSHMITTLPKLNEYVFGSPYSKYRVITSPNVLHNDLCKRAGLPDLTLHGLRRSFSTLSEWVSIPVGVVAQIQGHKPSAIAEKHYKVRPLDLLRMHHERLESWVLSQAGFIVDSDAIEVAESKLIS